MYLALIRKLALTAGTLLAIVACGDGYNTAGGGTGGTGVSSGPITGFGSVIVNGVEFFTTTATTTAVVTEDGVDGPDESTDPHRGLRLGMVVKVEGTFDSDTTGTATTVTYQSNVIGPITAVTGQLSSLAVGPATVTVLGQSVVIDSQTWIGTPTTDGTPGAAGLAQGNMVVVSGLLDANGAIHATRVEKTAESLVAGTEIEVKGVVANGSLNLNSTTFKINELTVNYSGIALPAGFGEGKYVEVKGTVFDAATITLTATKIELDDDGVGAVADGERVEVEGYITAGNADLFTVRGQQVQTTQATEFRNGDRTNVAPDRKVEVEGTVTGVVLMATKVEFK